MMIIHLYIKAHIDTSNMAYNIIMAYLASRFKYHFTIFMITVWCPSQKVVQSMTT